MECSSGYRRETEEKKTIVRIVCLSKLLVIDRRSIVKLIFQYATDHYIIFKNYSTCTFTTYMTAIHCTGGLPSRFHIDCR